MNKNTQKQKIIIICGPTGSGKSGVALSLCNKFNGAIISADSRQIYKGMDIGTGKEVTNSKYQVVKQDNKWVINGVKIYGYDIINPNEEFSVSHYEKKVFDDYLLKITKSHKIPFLVGGTGFFIRSIIDGIDTINIPRNQKLREELEKIKADQGVEGLYNKLRQINLQKASNIDPRNPNRIVRAIEISLAKSNGVVISRVKRSFDSLFIGINWERSDLYERIDSRIDIMIKEGLIGEIKSLLASGYSWILPSMRSIGYLELKPYFEKEKELDKCVQRLKWNTHAYARRQLTWFKKDKRINWFDLGEKMVVRRIEELINNFLGKE